MCVPPPPRRSLSAADAAHGHSARLPGGTDVSTVISKVDAPFQHRVELMDALLFVEVLVEQEIV